MSFQAIMTRLGCAKMMLAKAKTPQERKVMSGVQKATLVDLFKKDTKLMRDLEPENRSKMLALLNQCTFAESGMAKLLVLVAPEIWLT